MMMVLMMLVRHGRCGRRCTRSAGHQVVVMGVVVVMVASQ